MAKDSPDFQLTIALSAVPTKDNPDWQITATAPGGGSLGGAALLGLISYEETDPAAAGFSPSNVAWTVVKCGSAHKPMRLTFKTAPSGAGSTTVLVRLRATIHLGAAI